MGMCYFYNWKKALKVFCFLILLILHFGEIRLASFTRDSRLQESKADFCGEPFLKARSAGSCIALPRGEVWGAVSRGR